MGSIKTKEGPLQSHWSRNAGGDCEATTMGSIKTKRRPFAEPLVAERGWRLRSNNNGLNYKQKGPLLSRRPHAALLKVVQG